MTDLVGFAFQIYATFVASSDTLEQNYELLARSVLENMNNWGKDMKYLIPALGVFLTTIICKHPQFVS